MINPKSNQIVTHIHRTSALALSNDEREAWIGYLQSTCMDPAVVYFFIEVFQGNLKLVEAICQPGMRIETLQEMFMLQMQAD